MCKGYLAAEAILIETIVLLTEGEHQKHGSTSIANAYERFYLRKRIFRSLCLNLGPSALDIVLRQFCSMAMSSFCVFSYNEKCRPLYIIVSLCPHEYYLRCAGMSFFA